MGATASKHCCIDLSMLLLFLYEQKNCRREGIISPPARPCPNAFVKEVLHKKRSSKNLPLNFWNPIFCFLFRPHFTSFGMWKMLGVLNHTADADSDSKAAEPGWCFFFWNIRMMLLPFPFPVHGDVRKRKKLKSQRETDSSWQCHHFELQQPAAPAL